MKRNLLVLALALLAATTLAAAEPSVGIVLTLPGVLEYNPALETFFGFFEGEIEIADWDLYLELDEATSDEIYYASIVVVQSESERLVIVSIAEYLGESDGEPIYSQPQTFKRSSSSFAELAELTRYGIEDAMLGMVF